MQNLEMGRHGYIVRCMMDRQANDCLRAEPGFSRVFKTRTNLALHVLLVLEVKVWEWAGGFRWDFSGVGDGEGL